ncbi:hypothetical protein B0H10DRAFT_2205555 [Mycena sp. CBHHK59/15]|nr:hypothetical protein B0H10DRAFT_2205555 [Mycena sp. CBHHK59/15]
MEKSLAARISNIPFRRKTLKIDFEGAEFGGVYEVEIEFRDPWEIMKQWVTDESLAPVSTWFSQEKYLCEDGTINLSNRLYDEPCTGRTWGHIDPDSLRQIDPNTLTGLARSEYDRLKRLIYRGVCHLVMASLERRSHNGEALRFGDGVTRVAYPGVLIESMDFEELAAWLAIRNSTSLHPCPQCLVHKNDSHDSPKCSPSILPSQCPAPSLAHQLEKPIAMNSSSNMAFMILSMANFPRWRDLKHISSPTTIDYSDGQTFLDILKCALPCIVQLLPANSCLVQLIRIMNKTRVLLGLEVATDTRLDRLRKFIADYEKICKDVSETHNKSLIFLKQHFLSHAIACFKDKGTSRNQNTRVGEGFQQEIAAQYRKTNGKDAEHQALLITVMSIMDENEETMARLDMKVKEWQKSQEEDEADPVLPSHTATDYWRLGSADARISSIRIETLNRGNPLYRDFNMRLREYLAGHHPKHPVHEDQNIQIEPCKVLYVEFQSKVDWNSGRDILRCNPKFHGRPRYDSVIYEAHDDDLAMGQLELVFRCHLPHKVTLDLALIQPYRKSSWAPRTRTDCPIREWSPGSLFITMEHITRGALLCPFLGPQGRYFM